jgi:hypothetical protein
VAPQATLGVGLVATQLAGEGSGVRREAHQSRIGACTTVGEGGKCWE